MSAKRTFAIVFIGGFYSAFVSAALDGRWPSFSLPGFLIFVGGLAVLGGVFVGLQALFGSRRDH